MLLFLDLSKGHQNQIIVVNGLKDHKSKTQY
jgi:hypothetical protein